MKTSRKKTIFRTISVTLLLLSLFLGGGAAYVYHNDTATKPRANSNSSNNNDSTYVQPKPTQPSSNAPEGAAVESVTSPVAIGSNSSITVSTNAGSTCSIAVVMNGTPSADSGLSDKKADAYGNVTWSWTVKTNDPVGTWPIKITCIYNGRSAVVDTNFQVTK